MAEANKGVAQPPQAQSTDLMVSSGTAMRGEIDVQIATARAYPRSITEFHQRAMAMVTLNQHTAESCIYALPRGKKAIEGPSIRLAEIVASSYGHLTIAGRVIGEDEKFIYAEGVAWDVQNNVRVLKSIRRRITTTNGTRYNDDMIAVTANAAASIAMRNAVFACVPRALVGPLYEAAIKVAGGTEGTLEATRQTVLAYFKEKHDVSPERVLRAVGKEGVEDLGVAAIRILKGFATTIQDGEASVETIFPEKPVNPADIPASQSFKNKLKQADKKRGAQAPPADAEPPVDDPAPTEPEPQVPTEKVKRKRKPKATPAPPPPGDDSPPTTLGFAGETQAEASERITLENTAKRGGFTTLFTDDLETAQLAHYKDTGERLSLAEVQGNYLAAEAGKLPRGELEL